MDNQDFIKCSFCGNAITEDADYCTNCGHLFTDDILCGNHEDIEAVGVCIVCSVPQCQECGSFTDNKFFCNKHNDYEIVDNTVRIFGSTDINQIKYFESILLQEGLHPFILNKSSSSLVFTETEYSFFKNKGDGQGKILNEIKLLLPFSEVLRGELVVNDLLNSNEA